jgi:hypothetical protein
MMKRPRFRVASNAASLALVAAACSTSAQNQPPAIESTTIGPSGGKVTAPGAVLDVPAGALPAPTTISITEDPDGVPSPYVSLSPLYRFAPDGLTFARPVSVSFSTTSSSSSGAHVYWSLASGAGYQALPSTWVGATVSAAVTHFSTGFVGRLPDNATMDASGENEAAAQDATLDGESSEASPAAVDGSGAYDGTISSDGSVSGDAAVPDDGSLPDAGSTFVTGVIEGINASGATVTVDVDELSAIPDGDGGCTGQAATGHQDVSIPASALPYLYRFHFGSSTTPSCTGRSYVVNAVELDADGGVVATGTGDACTGTFGTSVSCPELFVSPPPSDAGAPDASDAGAPEASSSTGDGGDPYTMPITFTGTITGNLPPGASYLAVTIVYARHVYATLGNDAAPTCATPTVLNDNQSAFLVPTLPLTYSLTVPNDQPLCDASFQLKAYAADAGFRQLSGTTAGITQCGYIGGCPGQGSQAGCGGPEITSTSVTCDTSLP